MKLIKSLLLGTAAGFVATAGAQAADLPSKKAAPANYVQICPQSYGAGFFVIPGTDTCLRVLGRVRAEYLVGDRYRYAQDAYGFRARGQIRLDARNATAYGTLRTFVNYEVTNSGGAYTRGVNSTGPNATAITNGAGTSGINMVAAFVQFGPITAGRAQSFFDFYADALNYGPIRGSDLPINLLAYTATFGGGFSATISLEDGTERSQTNTAYANTLAYGGQTMPDVVANVALTQGWGTVQLSGALHQARPLNRVPAAINPLQPYVGEKFGFAIQGGLKLNLPMLAAGDVFWLQAAYAEGAISYLGFGGAGQGQTWGPNSNVGEINIINGDGLVDATGRLRQTKGWNVTAGLLHYWTPTIRQGFYGSYSRLENSALVANPYIATLPGFLSTSTNQIPRSVDELRLGTNLIWSPVAGLDIGVEVLYAMVDPKGRVLSSKAAALGFTATAANAARFKGNDDAWQGRLRIQRDF
jgi:Porin subfamily